ncbi:hypothetical protein [Mycobacterium intracellulare]|uniref:hypothetical protein n=1 Tax=Mycobacterium intracellulare TaxID=1767 RepID=UPI002595FBC2|nr:hypothetical protein [Mycobacterium intracellulare]MDM3894795.1 hypothetical protein [Mycobacterium intracellulare]
MKPWRWWWTMPLLIFAGIVGPGMAAAHADPIPQPVINYAAHNASRVCAALDAAPTFPGISNTLDSIQRETGFNPLYSADVLVLSVDAVCPRHLPLLQNFVNTYAPATTPAATTGGQVI